MFIWTDWTDSILVRGPLLILIQCMIFLSLFLDVARVSMSTIFFLAQLDFGILCLQNAFFWPMIYMTLNLDVILTFYLFPSKQLSYMHFIFFFFRFLFLVTPCLLVAVQPYTEWILKKNTCLKLRIKTQDYWTRLLLVLKVNRKGTKTTLYDLSLVF